jgi:hypothetical protein
MVTIIQLVLCSGIASIISYLIGREDGELRGKAKTKRFVVHLCYGNGNHLVDETPLHTNN